MIKNDLSIKKVEDSISYRLKIAEFMLNVNLKLKKKMNIVSDIKKAI